MRTPRQLYQFIVSTFSNERDNIKVAVSPTDTPKQTLQEWKDIVQGFDFWDKEYKRKIDGYSTGSLVQVTFFLPDGAKINFQF